MATRKPAIPGEPAPAADDSPFGDATQEQINRVLAEQLTAARDELAALTIRVAQLENRAAQAQAIPQQSVPELTAEEARVQARNTGRAALSRDGWIMPDAH